MHATPFAPGAYAVDTRTGRVGRVSTRAGGTVLLRLPGGGPPWECPAADLRPATAADRLRARVTELNWRSRLP
ncbi:hypothetical protein GL263_10345 [Streptomyces durbertensis]|uniref:Secreted protein n=1 Tax=Streptomyces durbertensis TaxID=2448886 RepID=A0ABR6EF50_9ACTN|nr:hypothetical protein [Streptomyces durbertensis]MBB1243952.1 hypothetical protein [Streptomyces durbertensis]